jgi:hypothetical protein
MNYNNSLSLWNFDEYFLKCRVRQPASVQLCTAAALAEPDAGLIAGEQLGRRAPPGSSSE